MMNKPRVRAVAAVIVKDGKYFAAIRGYGFLKGYFEFPGGKIEDGETPEEALRREIEEELSSEIEVGEKLLTVNYEYPDFFLDMDVFFAVLKQGRLLLHEGIHLQERFFDLIEMDETLFCPADQAIVKALKARSFALP